MSPDAGLEVTTGRLQILLRCRQRHEQREHGADDVKTGLGASVAAVRTDINGTETAQCADIAKVRAELKTDTSSVRTDLEAKIAWIQVETKANIVGLRPEIGDLEARLYRQLWIMVAGTVGLTVALVKLLY